MKFVTDAACRGARQVKDQEIKARLVFL